MLQLVVTVKKLNIRKAIPARLPDDAGIIGIVTEHSVIDAEEVTDVPNPALGKWYRDKNNHFFWGGGLKILDNKTEKEPGDAMG
jgi:chitosanase